MIAICVLIPLVQGRFLFARTTKMTNLKRRLNPFGSGTFFIQGLHLIHKFFESLNPFGSGTFFIP